ncbi:MAG: DUF5689 domain-containing protein [Bacteroidales bacterium]
MNTLSKIIAGIIIVSGITSLTGCVKGDPDVPVIIVPHAGFPSNTTISQLIAMHTTGGLESITTDVIIEGVVVANDESGNFYKQIIIEDDSAGLQIQMEIPSNLTTLSYVYKLGQRVFVKCKGLALGEYGGNMQLGYIVSGAIGRIPADSIKNHLFLEGFPETVPTPVNLTIPTLSNAKLNMLVKLDSIHFEDAGQVFSLSTASTNRNMLDQDGNILILRTSNYASFRGNLLPAGIGSVTGILSIYNGDFQFFIRDLNDLYGFTP